MLSAYISRFYNNFVIEHAEASRAHGKNTHNKSKRRMPETVLSGKALQKQKT
jgi:hypothetical protein